MDALKIKPTANSLEVSLDAETGKFSFVGRSYPENSSGFFKPVMEWAERYAQSPAAKTECMFKLEYFNSASRKCIIELLKILDTIHKNTRSVTIIWNFEEDDENMKETGEEYQNLFNLNFKFSSY